MMQWPEGELLKQHKSDFKFCRRLVIKFIEFQNNYNAVAN